ncbi:MAG: NnrS family protein, partial [Methylococcales bacterium]
MLTLDDNPLPKPFSLFNLGFRPFFLLAGLFAVVSMLIWMALYLLGADLLPAKLPSMLWHGHEM